MSDYCEPINMHGAQFTMRLVDVIERTDIWDDPKGWPIFDEVYRKELQGKIEDHYALYEIGTETVGQFRFMLNRKMREIMPLYNQLYASQTLVAPADALLTLKMTTDATTAGNEQNTSHQSGTSTSDTTGTSRTVSSDTPQTRLAGDEDYATGGVDVNGDTTVNGSNTGDATQTGQTSGTMSNTVTGQQGHTAMLLMQYRATFLNLDMDIIRELETLFMQVWDNGDNYSGRGNRGFLYGWGRAF